jgi:hypothetical protein
MKQQPQNTIVSIGAHHQIQSAVIRTLYCFLDGIDISGVHDIGVHDIGVHDIGSMTSGTEYVSGSLCLYHL